MSPKKTIPKAIRQMVWNMHIGEKNGVGLCQCCKMTSITQMNFQCGHIISEFNGGDITLNNLIPLCQLCNTSMGKINMDEFIKKHGIDNFHKEKDIKQNNEEKKLDNIKETKNTTKEQKIKETTKEQKTKTKEKCDNDDDIKKFLDTLSLPKLKQLCVSLSSRIESKNGQCVKYISPNGTKQKLADKIISNKYITLEINIQH